MEKKSIGINYIYNLSFQILNVILPLITTPYVSRVLGASNLGVYSYTDSLTAFFLLFATLGILNYGSREIARVRDNLEKRATIFWELVIFKFITSIICIIVFVIYFLLFENKNALIYGILSINFITNILEIGWFYNGLEQFKTSSLKNSFVKLFGVLLVFALVKDKNDLPMYILCMVLPGLVGNILLWCELRKYIVKVSFKQLKPFKHLKNILVFFIPAVSVQIYHMADKLMLQWILKDNYQNGIYSQAYKIIVVVLAVITSYNAVMFSRMSNLHANKDFTTIDSYLQRSASFIEMLGFAMSVGLFFIAPRFVPVFFGKGYDEVVILIRIFAPMILITGLSNMIGNQCLIPAGQQSKSNVAVVSGSVLNLILNAFLIRWFGAVGASIATVSSETLILIIMCAYAKKIISILLKQGFNYLCGSAILGIVVYIIDLNLPHSNNVLHQIFYLCIMIIAGIVAYFGFLIIRKDSLIMELTTSIRSKFKNKTIH